MIEKLELPILGQFDYQDACLVDVKNKLNQVIDVLNGITKLIDNVDNDRKREKE